MALRPRLSTGLPLSVSRLSTFNGSNAITPNKATVKTFILDDRLGFCCQISFVLPELPRVEIGDGQVISQLRRFGYHAA
jgi:hypothetical protein